MADIKWFGHACVQIRSRGATVMMDPAPRSLGYRFPKQKADIVTISHDHPGHTATEVISSPFRLIDGPGEYEISEVFVTGVRAYHDDQEGAERGKNTIYLVEIDGVTICHLGDIGHELSDEQAQAIEVADVLLIPVGGGPVIDAAKASTIVGQLEPGVVIPIQYRTPMGDSDLDEVDRFLKEMAVSDIDPVDRYTVRKTEVGDAAETTVVLLACSANA